MFIREASLEDIARLQIIRNAVKENVLSDPQLVPDEDCRTFLTARGKGWVGEVRGEVVGFAIADLVGHNIWALFGHPAFEWQGIGRQLHDPMLAWYFGETGPPVWLSTAPGTRAEGFYRAAGWREIGPHGQGELKFELTRADWEKRAA